MKLTGAQARELADYSDGADVTIAPEDDGHISVFRDEEMSSPQHHIVIEPDGTIVGNPE